MSGDTPGRGAILDLLQNPEEKEALSRLTAVMSLLEGHANVVMDAVDASIVPSVKTIRQRFNERGKDRGVIEKFIRSLLGLDAKMRQYSDGAKFVRAVVEVVGVPRSHVDFPDRAVDPRAAHRQERMYPYTGYPVAAADRCDFAVGA